MLNMLIRCSVFRGRGLAVRGRLGSGKDLIMFSLIHILHFREKICSNLKTIHIFGHLKSRKKRVFCPCVIR